MKLDGPARPVKLRKVPLTLFLALEIVFGQAIGPRGSWRLARDWGLLVGSGGGTALSLYGETVILPEY